MTTGGAPFCAGELVCGVGLACERDADCAEGNGDFPRGSAGVRVDTGRAAGCVG